MKIRPIESRPGPLTVVVLSMIALLPVGALPCAAGANNGRFYSLLPVHSHAAILSIDEVAGTVGPARLGQTLTEITKVLAPEHKWKAVSLNSGSLYYCELPTKMACNPPFVEFASRLILKVTGLPGRIHWQPSSVVSIDLWSNTNGTAGEDALTAGGVHMGSSLAQITTAYHLAGHRKSCHVLGKKPAEDYYVYAGTNTLLFTTYNGRVVRIGY